MATKATSYAALKKQMEELEAQMAEARAAEVSKIVEEIREKCAMYELTAEDIFGRTRGPRGAYTPRGPGVPKYRNPENGATWTGRGKPPAWIAGKDRAQFAI